MYTSIRILAALLLCTIAASAQDNQPADASIDGSIAVATTPVELEVPLPNAKKVKYAWTVTISGRTDGTIACSIDAAGVAFTGDVEALSTLTAATIFDAIAARSAAVLVELGYAACTPGGLVDVSVAACVGRTATGFAAIGSDVARRTYAYGCSSTGPAITLVATRSGSTCGTAAEPTLVDDGAQIR